MSNAAYHPPEAWLCNECKCVHDSEDDARECCPPSISEGYACPLCGRFHSDETDAIGCCGFDPEAPPPTPTAAELEAAGQMRLLP